MCMKLHPGDLNLDLYPLHLTNTYIYGVTIAPRVYDGRDKCFLNLIDISLNIKIISVFYSNI